MFYIFGSIAGFCNHVLSCGFGVSHESFFVARLEL
jgi:hypothetical protein